MVDLVVCIEEWQVVSLFGVLGHLVVVGWSGGLKAWQVVMVIVVGKTVGLSVVWRRGPRWIRLCTHMIRVSDGLHHVVVFECAILE